MSQNWIQLRHTTTTSALPYSRLHYTIPHYTTQNYKTLHCTTLHYLHYTTATAATALATTLITLHYDYGSTTLRYNYSDNCNYNTTALHHTASSSCGKVTTATIATTPENTTPTTCRSISGFALPSVIRSNQPLLSYRFPIFETFATASTGKSRGISSLCFKQLLFSAFSLVL